MRTRPWTTEFDGTPCAVKVARTVWIGGKGGDCIKTLPIDIWCQVSGHEAADGWRRRGTDRHDSGAAVFWTFWLNYGILKLKGNRIRYNPKKSVKINRSCGL